MEATGDPSEPVQPATGLAQPEYQWTPPTYAFSSELSPALLSFASVQSNPKLPYNFYRTAKWCPDGSCALTSSEDQSLRIHSMSPDFTSIKGSDPLPQPAPILDFAWYPSASALNPATFCFVASVRDCPVKLLDAATGRLRASYKIVDHRERFIAPHCMVFDHSGSRLYCSFEDAIEIFDVHRPGEGVRLPTTPSKKTRSGLKGIVSSLAFCPDYSGTYAAASLSASPLSSIVMFSEDTPSPLFSLDGVRRGGVTQVQFNPTHPHILYAASRRSDHIQSWDLRNPTVVFREYARQANTNQRLRFDVDITGKWLCTGDKDGRVSTFDLTSEALEPVHSFQAHTDAIGSTAFHMLEPLLLTVSGSRHFSPPLDDDESSSDSDIGHESARPSAVFTRDSTIKVWKAGSFRDTEGATNPNILLA